MTVFLWLLAPWIAAALIAGIACMCRALPRDTGEGQ